MHGRKRRGRGWLVLGAVTPRSGAADHRPALNFGARFATGVAWFAIVAQAPALVPQPAQHCSNTCRAADIPLREVLPEGHSSFNPLAAEHVAEILDLANVPVADGLVEGFRLGEH